MDSPLPARITYRLLHVEDFPGDEDLLRIALKDAPFGFTLTRVANEPDYSAQLEAGLPDAILCDYQLSGFSTERALEIIRARNLDVPFIVVSHHLGETAAVVAMQKGASDYLPKRDLRRLARAIASAVDARESRRRAVLAQEAVRESAARLQTLSKRMLAMQEDERRALSRELHDDIGQTLGALKIGLYRLTTTASAEQPALVAECLRAADQALAKLRFLAMELRPPQLDQLGLREALEWLAQHHGAASGLAIRCSFSGLGARAPAAIESACYRIAQEALNNATRHGKATAVVVSVESDSAKLVLAIDDDGVGFDEATARRRLIRSGSMGLIGMEERARLAGGCLTLRSAPGAGTTVSATFPLQTPPPSRNAHACH